MTKGIYKKKHLIGIYEFQRVNLLLPWWGAWQQEDRPDAGAVAESLYPDPQGAERKRDREREMQRAEDWA